MYKSGYVSVCAAGLLSMLAVNSVSCADIQSASFVYKSDNAVIESVVVHPHLAYNCYVPFPVGVVKYRVVEAGVRMIIWEGKLPYTGYGGDENVDELYIDRKIGDMRFISHLFKNEGKVQCEFFISPFYDDLDIAEPGKAVYNLFIGLYADDSKQIASYIKDQLLGKAKIRIGETEKFTPINEADTGAFFNEAIDILNNPDSLPKGKNTNKK